MIHDVDQLLERLVNERGAERLVGGARLRRADEGLGRPAERPAVDLYLYDIREDLQRRVPAWEDVKDNGGETKGRRLPPRRFRLAYLVTAWTQRPEDEHRLLSALLGCFVRNAMLKPEELEGGSPRADLPVYIDVAQPPSQDRSLADVWSALGGELKPSLDVVVTAPMVVGRTAPYEPPVLIGPTIGGRRRAQGRRTRAAGAGSKAVAGGGRCRGDRAARAAGPGDGAHDREGRRRARREAPRSRPRAA